MDDMQGLLCNLMLTTIRLGPREVGEDRPCFIVAEAGVNHNGSVEMARRMVRAAASAGVDAVKFQTFCADALATDQAPKAEYQKRATGESESQLEMLRRLELTAADHLAIMRACADEGVLFLSTPFEPDSADLLERLGVVAFKISSGDLTDVSLLAHIASKQRPMIVSTGMARMEEVEVAIQTIAKAGNDQAALLHCVSAYPADPASANLRAMRTLRSRFGVPVGYSDHTLGIAVALGAVALGACIIEKHFTLDRMLPGPDQSMSLEPAELVALVRGIRTVEAALGDGRKKPLAAELATSPAARKSLVARIDIAAGTVLEAPMVTVKRPGTGLPPTALPELLGRVAAGDIAAGALLSRDLFEPCRQHRRTRATVRQELRAFDPQ